MGGALLSPSIWRMKPSKCCLLLGTFLGAGGSLAGSLGWTPPRLRGLVRSHFSRNTEAYRILAPLLWPCTFLRTPASHGEGAVPCTICKLLSDTVDGAQ